MHFAVVLRNSPFMRRREVPPKSMQKKIKSILNAYKSTESHKNPARTNKLRTHKIKPYVIHILAVPALSSDNFDLPSESNAVIICTNRTNRFIESLPQENTLIIDFPDVENRHFPGAFNGAHARRIIAFLDHLSDSVSDVYVCCSKGGSRSPAVAAAILRASGRSGAPVWEIRSTFRTRSYITAFAGK